MEEPKITSGTVPYIASEIPDDPRDITPEQWEAMKAVDIRTVDKSQLVDLSTVHIDESLPVRERVLSYLKQVKNPYCVRVGNFAVKVKYKEDGPSFEEVQTMLSRILDHISLESVRATWEAGLYLYRTDFPVQLDAKVACWYGEKEGHMKKAIQKLRKVYPKLTVRCFSDFGHGDIINHPELFVEEMI